jgi:hypothetical protein
MRTSATVGTRSTARLGEWADRRCPRFFRPHRGHHRSSGSASACLREGKETSACAAASIRGRSARSTQRVGRFRRDLSTRKVRLLASPLHMGTSCAKKRHIREVFGTRRCDLVTDERGATDDGYSRVDDGDLDAAACGLGERHAADSSQDVDSARFSAQHPYEARFCQLGGLRDHAAEAKLNQRRVKPSCVWQRRLNEHVEVLREARLRVDRQRVPSDQEVSGSRRGQRTQELVPVVVQVQSP